MHDLIEQYSDVIIYIAAFLAFSIMLGVVVVMYKNIIIGAISALLYR